jgi:cytochrome c-type biogenesis protein CcmF
VAFALGMRRPYPLTTIGLAGWNLASVGLLLAGAIVPRARITGRSLSEVFTRYAFEQKRRVGSMVVHLGVVVIALGIVGSGGYRIDQQLRLGYGERVPFQGYELEALRPFTEQEAGRASVGVEVAVYQRGERVTVLTPRINRFGTSQMTVPTPSVRYTVGHDLYLALAGAVDPQQDFVIIRAVQSPLVTWIWIGGAIVALGTAYALTPGDRPLRRRVRAEATAGAEA